MRGGGGGAPSRLKGVCRLAVPGERACASLEEGILHLWMGGSVRQGICAQNGPCTQVPWSAHHWIGGVEGPFRKTAGVGSLLGSRTPGGISFAPRESGTVVAPLTRAACRSLKRFTHARPGTPPPPIVQATVNDQKLTDPPPRIAWPYNDDGRHPPASLWHSNSTSSLGECLPGVRPARYLCIEYLISSPRFILTLGSPPRRPH